MSLRQDPYASLFPDIHFSFTDTFHYERTLSDQGFSMVAGVDEAGRGPLAGPVVAACVVLPETCEYHRFQDSKKLSSRQRFELFDYLHSIDRAHIGVSIVEPDEIDAINILQASLKAMKKSVYHLAERSGGRLPSFLLIDGKFEAPIDLPQKALVKGESKSASIAAASIVAKVTRDRIMEQLHLEYPAYNLAKNKGYPTKAHRQAIETYGPSPIHRKSFKGVKEHCERPLNETFRQETLW